MKNKDYPFNGEHLNNIKVGFEEKTGVQLMRKKTGHIYRRVVAVILVAMLCVATSISVFAMDNPNVYRIMYGVSPNVAQFFKSVQKSDEDNGIKLEVVSARIRGDTAEIYITMQDLTGDRVDDTIDLFDSYSINRPFGGTGFCEQVDYDEKTKTATFLITIKEWGNHDITGDKITFTLKKFLSNKNIYDDMVIPIDTSVIKSAENVQQVYSHGGGGDDYPVDSSDNITSLIPSEPMQDFPIDGIELTGVGYIDGKLHIQAKLGDITNTDNHGFFYLKDSDGNTVTCDYNFYFTNGKENTDQRIDYCEFIFNIPQEDIKNYSVYGSFVTADTLVEGNWSVTFPIDQEFKYTYFINYEGLPIPENSVFIRSYAPIEDNDSIYQYLKKEDWWETYQRDANSDITWEEFKQCEIRLVEYKPGNMPFGYVDNAGMEVEVYGGMLYSISRTYIGEYEVFEAQLEKDYFEKYPN